MKGWIYNGLLLFGYRSLLYSLVGPIALWTFHANGVFCYYFQVFYTY